MVEAVVTVRVVPVATVKTKLVDVVRVNEAFVAIIEPKVAAFVTVSAVPPPVRPREVPVAATNVKFWSDDGPVTVSELMFDDDA